MKRVLFAKSMLFAGAGLLLISGAAAGETADADCPASSPKDGKAAIYHYFGTDAPPSKLSIKFSFGTPSSGDQYELVFSYAEESNPPSFVYNLARVEKGFTTDYTEIKDFLHEEEGFAEPALKAVKILCAGFKEPFVISPVEMIH